MKTKNFPGRKNNRRKVALTNLRKQRTMWAKMKVDEKVRAKQLERQDKEIKILEERVQ